MDLLVASHPSSLSHDTGPRHPERAERARAVLRGLDDVEITKHHLESPKIERTELALVHDPNYIEMIETFCELGGGALDMDTFASRESWEAALTSAGGVRVLIDELETRSDSLGFAVARPPGHHAMPDRAMGFCLFNNVAVAAAVLRSRGHRVAILDWDVHHGNGTQAMLKDDPGVLYLSVHQDHFYPFDGSLADIDIGEAKGTTVNIPLPAGTGSDAYRRAWSEIVIPVTEQFAPDWLFVSAGYDAHQDDMLAELKLTSDDYGWMAHSLSRIHPPSSTIVALEGGYDLDALRSASAKTVRGFAGESEWGQPATSSVPGADEAVAAAAAVIGQHWVL